MPSSALKISSIVADPAIKVNQTEDINLERAVRRLVVKAMNICEGNKLNAAGKLGVTKRTIYNYLEENFIVFDNKENQYVSLLDIVYNSDERNRFVGIEKITPEMLSNKKSVHVFK